MLRPRRDSTTRASPDLRWPRHASHSGRLRPPPSGRGFGEDPVAAVGAEFVELAVEGLFRCADPGCYGQNADMNVKSLRLRHPPARVEVAVSLCAITIAVVGIILGTRGNHWAPVLLFVGVLGNTWVVYHVTARRGREAEAERLRARQDGPTRDGDPSKP